MMDLSHVSRIDYEVVVGGRIKMVALFNSQKISEEDAMKFIQRSMINDYHPHILTMTVDQFDNIFRNNN